MLAVARLLADQVAQVKYSLPISHTSKKLRLACNVVAITLNFVEIKIAIISQNPVSINRQVLQSDLILMIEAISLDFFKISPFYP